MDVLNKLCSMGDRFLKCRGVLRAATKTLAVAVLLFGLWPDYPAPGAGNEGQVETCEDEAALEEEGTNVLAKVGNVSITQGEVDLRIEAQLLDMRKKLYELRKRHLDIMIKYKLLELEAAEKNVTMESLIETEIKPHLKPITDQDVESYLARFKRQRRTNVHLDETRVRDAIYAERYYEVFNQYVEQLKRKYRVSTFLAAPIPMAHAVATKDDPWKGNEQAPVTLVEFIDFQCASCAAFQETLGKILTEFEGKVKLVVRDYPITRHQSSAKAAEASACAHEQGKFWEYMDMLYQNQDALALDSLISYAGSLGIDTVSFAQCLESGKYREEAGDDKKDAIRAGVSKTPTIFVNDVKVYGLNYDAIKTAILNELARIEAEKSKTANP